MSEGTRKTTCYRKDRAIDKFREDMYSASDKVKQTVDVYTAMSIFNRYLDDTSAEWIKHVEGRWAYAKCSKCGSVHDVQSRFCPSCGCAMERWEEQA